MFSGTSYKIHSNNLEYDVIILFFSLTKIFIIDIKKDSEIIQCIIQNNMSPYISYTTTETSALKKMANILQNFLIDKKILHQSQLELTPYQILQSKNFKYNSPLYFRSAKHIFQAQIKDEKYHISVKFGGTTFEGCIEIMIHKGEDKDAVIAQIYSEPECAIDTLLQLGESIDMIKASLQLCQILFNINEFKFMDNSEFDCIEKNLSKLPPRRRTKPISLAHLHLIKYGKTWYEDKFNAILMKQEDIDAYRIAKDRLQITIDLSYDDFAKKNKITHEQYDALEEYYSNSTTWIEFFQSIPKTKHCELLNWAPSFMDMLMNFKINEQYWKIQLEGENSMIRTDVYILTNVLKRNMVGGSYRKYTRRLIKHRPIKKTNKARYSIYSFSNSKMGQTIM